MKDRTESGRGPAVSYTPAVRHLQRRVAGLFMAVVLSGPQVITAACEVVCTPSEAHRGVHSAVGVSHGSSQPGVVTESFDRETLASSLPAGGHHHGQTESIQRTGTSPTHRRVRGDRGACCPDAESMPVVMAADGRTDGQTSFDRVSLVAVAALLPLHRGVPAQPHAPPPAVASPAHRPLVLRI